ncbi:MAG: helix-turn-helix domain-containing protein [Psychrosphaera sp.]|nr:helix-turn-helix domain-containing protein [Psychrosphaera sp.]
MFKQEIFRFEVVAFNFNFSKVLAERRQALGWSVEYLACDLGVTVAFIQQIEDSALHFSIGEYVVVCRALNLDLALAVMEVEAMADPEDQYIEAQLKQNANKALLHSMPQTQQ